MGGEVTGVEGMGGKRRGWEGRGSEEGRGREGRRVEWREGEGRDGSGRKGSVVESQKILKIDPAVTNDGQYYVSIDRLLNRSTTTSFLLVSPFLEHSSLQILKFLFTVLRSSDYTTAASIDCCRNPGPCFFLVVHSY